MKKDTIKYSKPLVSILMSVKNEEEYIDDNSTDNTLKKIISNYSKEKEIQLLSANKSGKNNAFYQAYRISKGEFICYFAGDDVLELDTLENRIRPIINNLNDLVATVSRLRTISVNKINYFPYRFDFPFHGDTLDNMHAHLYSAMAQGKMLSFFVRLYEITKEQQYFTISEMIIMDIK